MRKQKCCHPSIRNPSILLASNNLHSPVGKQNDTPLYMVKSIFTVYLYSYKSTDVLFCKLKLSGKVIMHQGKRKKYIKITRHPTQHSVQT